MICFIDILVSYIILFDVSDKYKLYLCHQKMTLGIQMIYDFPLVMNPYLNLDLSWCKKYAELSYEN